MRNLRSVFNVVLVLAATSLTGCAGKFTGGGWIPSACDPAARATFGFTLHAADADGDGEADAFKGEFQLVDRACGARFHGDVVFVAVAPVGAVGNAFPLAYFNGTWRSPATGQAGTFEGVVEDAGEGGALGPDDSLEVLFYDAAGAQIYANVGPVGGGNVQYHAPADGGGGQ